MVYHLRLYEVFSFGKTGLFRSDIVIVKNNIGIIVSPNAVVFWSNICEFKCLITFSSILFL